MKLEDIKGKGTGDGGKRKAASTAAKYGLYIAVISLCTTFIEGGFRVAELMLEKDQAVEAPAPVVIIEENYPNEMAKSYPAKGGGEKMLVDAGQELQEEAFQEAPAMAVEDEASEQGGFFLTWRMMWIVLSLLVVLAGLELRKMIRNKRNSET